ncbi:MAG: alpha/beta hydrolase [Pseudomonadota bacterium]
MPTFTHGDVAINYEDNGNDAPAILLIAPGGMKSAIPFWDSTPWDPRDQLAESHRVIAMDQRNAGASTGPISAQDGWHTFAADQLGLMDHLGIERFHVAGMCIGGPYALGLIEQAPERVLSATLFQTIGRDNNEAEFFAMFDAWADALKSDFPDLTEGDWAQFRANMFGAQKPFFNLDVDFVGSVTTPLLVLMGNDVYHPSASSQLVASTAPNVTFIESWKEGAARDAAMSQFADFLALNQ